MVACKHQFGYRLPSVPKLKGLRCPYIHIYMLEMVAVPRLAFGSPVSGLVKRVGPSGSNSAPMKFLCVTILSIIPLSLSAECHTNDIYPIRQFLNNKYKIFSFFSYSSQITVCVLFSIHALQVLLFYKDIDTFLERKNTNQL